MFGILGGMCSHYDPQTDPNRLRANFGVEGLPLGLKPILWPGYYGPLVRKHEFADVGDDAVPFRELLLGSFGLIPHWSKDATIAQRTYNARSATAHEKPSYRDVWRLARHCIIPAEAIIPIERLIESRGEEIPEAMINALREKSIAFGK